MSSDGEPFWRQNLLVVWITQFITYLGFSMAMPFTPFYMRQDLCVIDEGMLKMYVGWAAALPALSLAVMSPIWGILADRYGRKLMMLRASFAGGVIIAGMGFAPQIGRFMQSIGFAWCSPVYIFLFLRLMQGMFTGTTSAAMTLVSSCTPRDRQGYALAILSTSVFSGDIAGNVLGGYLSSWIGFQNSFYIGGFLWFFSGLLVLFTAREKFEPKARQAVARSGKEKLLSVFLPGLPLFGIFIFANMARFIDSSQFPLVIEHLNGGKLMPFAARWTSLVLATGFIGAMFSGFIIGRFIDKHPKAVAIVSALGTGLFMALVLVLPGIMGGLPRLHPSLPGLPNDVSACVLAMFPIRFTMIFFSAGLEPVWNSWLSKLTPEDSKGLMFGSAVTFRSAGQILAHTTAAYFAMKLGFESIFILGPVLFILLIPAIILVEKQLRARVAL